MTLNCVKCDQPVDVEDLVRKEMQFRCSNRSFHAPHISDIVSVMHDHPALEACHEACDDMCFPPTRWVRFKRCNVKGCCVPLVPVQKK